MTSVPTSEEFCWNIALEYGVKFTAGRLAFSATLGTGAHDMFSPLEYGACSSSLDISFGAGTSKLGAGMTSFGAVGITGSIGPIM